MSHLPMPKLFLDLNDIPADGKDLDGELRTDIFNLQAEDPDAPQVTAPVEYDLHVELDRDLVIVSGSLYTQFNLTCTRCLARFPWPVELDDYLSEEPREGRANLDLTELIREDIILSLPGYPHCEESPLTPAHECPAADKFLSSSSFVPMTEEDATKERSRDAWSALDGLKATDESPQQPENK
jgi:uncharacterized protein